MRKFMVIPLRSELRIKNDTDEGISKKEEVRSAVEIRFTDFIELQGTRPDTLRLHLHGVEV
jgi:hypothetical protein